MQMDNTKVQIGVNKKEESTQPARNATRNRKGEDYNNKKEDITTTTPRLLDDK